MFVWNFKIEYTGCTLFSQYHLAFFLKFNRPEAIDLRQLGLKSRRLDSKWQSMYCYTVAPPATFSNSETTI